MQRLTICDAGSYTRSLQHAIASIDARSDDSAAHYDSVLAQLAAGHFERVRAFIHAAVAATGAANPSLPLITARYVAWTGDLRTAAMAWPHVRGEADALFAASSEGSASEGSAVDAWLRTTTAKELQRAATDLGDPMFAASLHRYAGTATSGDVGYAGTVQSDVRTADGARPILEFVHGLLGIEPDATRHRIRIRPRLNQQASLDVRQIRFGDGELRLRTAVGPSAEGRQYTVEIAQDSGAIPVTVVLEPIVAARVERTLVDGKPADLATRPDTEDTVIVPVQLVLDEERCLQIDVTG